MELHTHSGNQASQSGKAVDELSERIDHISACVDRITGIIAGLRGTELTSEQQRFLDQLEGEAQELQAENLRTNTEFNLSHNTQRTANQPTASKKESLAGIHVLLVEDDLIIRTLAINFLRRSGAEITVAVNGMEATGLTATNKFDIILMDMQMPMMNGFEASRIIRFEQKCTTPIIGLTANAVKNDEEQYYKAGMNDVMSKPYNQEKLVSIINKWTNAQVINDQEASNETRSSTSSLFDLNKLRGIGDPAFVNRMLQLFVDQVSPAVHTIRKAYDEKDFASVRYTTHRIRPSILNMGIDSVKTEIVEIEELAKANESNPALNEMIIKLEDVMTQVTAEVRKLL